MHNQHRMYRVFYILKQLQEEPAKSTHNIAKALKITVRSVYRYFNLLQELGYEVQKDERGKFFIPEKKKSNEKTNEISIEYRQRMSHHLQF